MIGHTVCMSISLSLNIRQAVKKRSSRSHANTGMPVALSEQLGQPALIGAHLVRQLRQ
jgi:hypothetical protein